MKIYRIAKQQYISDLSGEGARLYGGRWNKPSYNMLYCSKQLSLSVLELLVHVDYQFINQNFWFIEIELPEGLHIPMIPSKILKQDWRHNPPLEFTQNYGTDWLKSNKSMILSVPSAVLPNEYNLLLNPNHKDFNNIQITEKKILDLDSRVFK